MPRKLIAHGAPWFAREALGELRESGWFITGGLEMRNFGRAALVMTASGKTGPSAEDINRNLVAGSHTGALLAGCEVTQPSYGGVEVSYVGQVNDFLPVAQQLIALHSETAGH